MDVILDSNTYLSDPRMQGTGFRSLHDYLKKTGSRLIVPKVVLDEVVARYAENLESCIDQARPKVGKLRSLVLATRVDEIPSINVSREAARLKAKLARPAPKVRTAILNNFSDVGLDEVVKRGIQRIAPSSKGEQLRDVVLWLMILAYLKGARTPAAFITSDGHFRKENALHPTLVQDLKDRGVALNFYPSIDDFIKGNAPALHELAEEEALRLCEQSYVLDRFEIEARDLFQRRWPPPSSIEVTDRKLKLSKGALYDTGPSSQYGEIDFRVELRLTVTSRTQRLSYSYPSSSQWGAVNSGMLSPQQNWSQVLYGEPTFGFPNQPTTFPQLVMPARVTDWSYGGPAVGFGTPLNWAQPQTISINYPTFEESTSDFLFSGNIVISLRLVSGAVKEKEIERFEGAQFAQIPLP